MRRPAQAQKRELPNDNCDQSVEHSTPPPTKKKKSAKRVDASIEAFCCK